MSLNARGIYIITNTESGKVYVGSTATLFRKRRAEHRYHLRKGGHSNPHLQAAWDKYGEAAFEFGVLEHLDNPEELHLAEQFWIDIYREEGKELYNCGLAARHPMLGRTHTAETRAKIGDAARDPSEETRRKIGEANHNRSEEARAKMANNLARPYSAFRHRETGGIIPASRNLHAMCRERGLNRSHMRAVREGKRLHHKGWRLA